MAGKIAGLEGELEDYFLQLFHKRHELLGRSCPGELECCKAGGRIFERRAYEGQELPALRVCHGSEERGEPPCEALETKPGENPPHLTEGIMTAFSLTEIRRATYGWPDALTPVEWSCLRAIERAEHRFKREIEVEREEKARFDQTMRELDAQRHR